MGLFFFALPSLIFGPMHGTINNRPITGVEKMDSMSSSGTNHTVVQQWYCTTQPANYGIVYAFSAIALIITTAVCYGSIFHYFYQTQKELKQLSGPDAHLPSMAKKMKNLRLHILTLIILFTTTVVAVPITVLSKEGLQKTRYMHCLGALIRLCNSSINPWLTFFFVKDFRSKRCCYVEALAATNAQ